MSVVVAHNSFITWWLRRRGVPLEGDELAERRASRRAQRLHLDKTQASRQSAIILNHNHHHLRNGMSHFCDHPSFMMNPSQSSYPSTNRPSTIKLPKIISFGRGLVLQAELLMTSNPRLQ